jgi:serpin B
MLYSKEGYYIENEFFTGFRKPYKGNQYSFMALLPKKPRNDRFFRKAIEKIDFTRIFESARLKDVHVSMPEFTTEFGTDLKGLFMNMGIKEIFSDRADFSPLSGAWLKADSIIHKAKIEVDRKGTKAAAVTAMFVYAAGIPSFEYKVVDLDRPFVYAIVHNETGLPVFTGVVNEIR